MWCCLTPRQRFLATVPSAQIQINSYSPSFLPPSSPHSFPHLPLLSLSFHLRSSFKQVQFKHLARVCKKTSNTELRDDCVHPSEVSIYNGIRIFLHRLYRISLPSYWRLGSKQITVYSGQGPCGADSDGVHGNGSESVQGGLRAGGPHSFLPPAGSHDGGHAPEAAPRYGGVVIKTQAPCPITYDWVLFGSQEDGKSVWILLPNFGSLFCWLV